MGKETAIRPEAYARWRESELGERTESLEKEAVLALAGGLAASGGIGRSGIPRRARSRVLSAVDDLSEVAGAYRQVAVQNHLYRRGISLCPGGKTVVSWRGKGWLRRGTCALFILTAVGYSDL